MRGEDYVINNSFTNLVIENCNVLKPVSFVNADFVLESVYNTLDCLSDAVDESKQGPKEAASYLTVTADMLFNDDIMKKLADEGVRGCEDEHKLAVLSILTYLHGMQKSLYLSVCIYSLLSLYIHL